MSTQRASLSERLSQYQQHIKTPAPAVAGILTRVVGLTLEARGLRAPVGSQCKIETMVSAGSSGSCGSSTGISSANSFL